MDNSLPLIIKFPDNCKTLNNAQLLHLVSPTAGCRVLDERAFDLEETIARSKFMSAVTINSCQFDRKSNLKQWRLIVSVAVIHDGLWRSWL